MLMIYITGCLAWNLIYVFIWDVIIIIEYAINILWNGMRLQVPKGESYIVTLGRWDLNYSGQRFISQKSVQ